MKITSKECMSWVYAKYRFELNCIVWWIQFDNGVALHHQSFACSDQTVEVFQLKHVKRRKISQKIRFSLSLPFYHLWYVVRFIQKIPVFFHLYSIEHCSFFISSAYMADAVHFGVAERVQLFCREFHCTSQFNPNHLTQAQLGSCQYSFVCAMCAFAVSL